LLLALVVRTWQLGYHSVWFDEAVSLKWAGADLDYTWRTTFALVEDKHPPLYYLLLSLWQSLLRPLGLDQNDVALRVLGALLGLLTVWGVLFLVSRVSGKTVGRWAALLVALSPILTWYSQELRMFQPATTALVWGAAALYGAWHTPAARARAGWWLLMALALTAALYTYLFSAFLLPAAGLTLLILAWRTRDVRRFVEGSSALLLTGLLFLPLARNAWSVNQAESTPGQPFANFAANLLHLVGVHTIWRADWPPALTTAALSLFVLLIVGGLILPLRPTSRLDSNAHSRLDDRVWLWLWLGIPLLIANLLLARSRSIFAQDRYLLFLAPFLLWAAARGIVALASYLRPLGWATGTAAALALALALPVLWTPALARENWRAAAAYIDDYTIASPHLTEAVVTHIDYTHLPLEWYLRPRYTFAQLPVFFPFGGKLTPDDVANVVAPPLLGIVELGTDTLWLTQSHLEEIDDDRVVEGWLTQHYPLITEQFPAGVKLSGYMLRGRLDALPPLGTHALYPATELAPGLRLAACEIITPIVGARDDTFHPPSGWVHVRLWWEATAPLVDNYIATAQMIGPEGVWGDRLHRPTEALRFWPTSTWQPGEFVRDELDINLNPVTPPGDYPIVIGVMDGNGNPLAATVECGRVTIR
jgi:uncharacterized membrane protein